MEDFKWSEEDRKYVREKTNLLVRRAKGELLTGAAYIRKMVLEHPTYKKDSVVNDEIAFDICDKAAKLGLGLDWEPTLLGEKEQEG